MESNISTVAFRSNLYPVEKSFYEDSTFSFQKYMTHFSLEILKKTMCIDEPSEERIRFCISSLRIRCKKMTIPGEQLETSRGMSRSSAGALTRNAASFIVAVLILIFPS